MGLTPGFTKKDINDYIQKKLKGYRKAIELRLKRTGEEFVKLARENGQYLDQTGNLRSSIGYIVLYNGIVLSEDYKAVNNGSEGVKKAQSFAEKIADQYPEGFVLVCVAGMEYAAAVESKGKDVLTGSSQIAEQILKQALKRINDKIGG